MALTDIAAKFIMPNFSLVSDQKLNKFLGKKKNDFWRNQFTTSQILIIDRIIEGIDAINLKVTLLFVDFSKEFESIHRVKMRQILLAYASQLAGAVEYTDCISAEG